MGRYAAAVQYWSRVSYIFEFLARFLTFVHCPSDSLTPKLAHKDGRVVFDDFFMWSRLATSEDRTWTVLSFHSAQRDFMRSRTSFGAGGTSCCVSLLRRVMDRGLVTGAQLENMSEEQEGKDCGDVN